MQAIKLETLWQHLPPGLLDLGLRWRWLRSWALHRGEQQLYQGTVLVNKDQRPRKVQEMRYRALCNLLHTVDRALADGRISPQVRRAIIYNFVGALLMDGKRRQAPFSRQENRQPPFFLTISPTKKCNLKCRGCYAVSSARNAETLHHAVLRRIIREKTELWGSHFTVISGGEPLLYRSDGYDLFKLLADNQDNYFLMYTNGTLISREVAERLAELGNITPAISVEGFEKETDSRRGSGAYKRVLQAMANLRRAGVPFGISVTATRDNAELLLSDRFVDFFFGEQGAIYGWIFQYMPIGRSYTTELMVTPEQRRWMLEQELRMLYDRNLFYVDFWNSGPLSSGCLAGGRSGGYFYIDWNGNIAPCVFFPYYVDNIYEIYGRNLDLNAILDSDLFRTIRKWQDGYAYKRPARCMGNLFMPCSIRDHYRFAYGAIQKFGAKPMDAEAAQALADKQYRRQMVDYDQRLRQLLDPLWEELVLAPEGKRRQPKVASTGGREKVQQQPSPEPVPPETSHMQPAP